MINAKAMRCACIFKSEYSLNYNVEISNISKKSQIVNILNLAGHTVSTATFQLCHHSVKTATEYLNEWVWLCDIIYKNKRWARCSLLSLT